MNNLRCLSAVITLLAFLNTVSANCGNSSLYEKMREALLTEDNINRLRNIFYPNDGSVVSDVQIAVFVPATDQCTMGHFSYTFMVHVTSSWDIKSYLTKFLVFLKFTDLTFYTVLSTLTNSNNNTFDIFDYYYNGGMVTLGDKSWCPQNYDGEVFEPCLESLFSWVSDYNTIQKSQIENISCPA